MGNFVWQDLGPGSPGGLGTADNGLFDEDQTQAGINGVKVTLTITYPDGTVVVLNMLTGDEPGTGYPGWYTFGNLLLDENYSGDVSGSDPGEPAYVLSIGTAPDSFPYSTYQGTPDALGIGQGTNNNADNSADEPAFPVQGGADDTNDFGFSSQPLALDLLSFGGSGLATATPFAALCGLVLLVATLGLFAPRSARGSLRTAQQ